MHFICINSHTPSLTLLPELRKTSTGLPLILHYGELYNYFIMYHDVIITEIKCTTNLMSLNHPEIILHPPPHLPGPWKACLEQNWPLVPKRLGTVALIHFNMNSELTSSLDSSEDRFILSCREGRATNASLSEKISVPWYINRDKYP